MKNTAMSNNNPFENLSNVVTNNQARKLSFTPALIDRANQRAQEIMLKGAECPELANKVINDGNTSDLLELIRFAIDEQTLAEDAKVLDGCDADQLDRLLESRRSERSKSKKKGLNTSVIVCKTYISAMYAELMIRAKMNKPYTGQPGATQYDIEELAKDQDALERKIASLRSKQSRLKPLAEYDEKAKAELSNVRSEIERLIDLRVGTRSKSKTVVKSVEIDAIREALKSIDPGSLPEEERDKVLALMAKLG